MSEVQPISATGGASFEGPDVSIRDLGPVGMVTVRGDFASKAFQNALKTVAGCDLPAQRRVETGDEAGLVWMSPDELLLVCAYREAEAMVAALSDALKGEHFMAQNVSDARAAFSISGDGARELIAKGAPVDMSADAFGEGDVRRSRIGQVAAAFWLGEEGFTLVCFRSLGAYMFDWLKASAVDGARPGII